MILCRSKAHAQVWQPPLSNCIKTNWDIALDFHSKKMGISIILRDENEFVIASKQLFKFGNPTPQITES